MKIFRFKLLLYKRCNPHTITVSLLSINSSFVHCKKQRIHNFKNYELIFKKHNLVSKFESDKFSNPYVFVINFDIKKEINILKKIKNRNIILHSILYTYSYVYYWYLNICLRLSPILDLYECHH